MPHLHHDNKTIVVYEWELVPRFYNSISTLKSEIGRYKNRADGVKKVQRGGNGSCMLLSYDSLREDIKIALGDPRKTDNALEQFYKICPDAALFYETYEFNDGTRLKSSSKNQYVINASTLKAVAQLMEKRAAMRGTTRKIMPSILADLKVFNTTLENKHGVKHTLPTSEKRLKMDLSDFQTPFTYKGKEYKFNYASVISGKEKNQNSAKIRTDETSQDILQSLLEHPNQYDDVFIARAYNKKAKALNLKPITSSTVGIWRRKLEPLIMANREGWNVYKDNFSRSVKRLRPSQPTYLWESDDNHLDLLFNGDDKSPYHRFKGIFVTDSYCDLPLGYACCEGEMTPDLVKFAYINAMYYIKSLTGGWYLPHEVKTDRWRMAVLMPYYERIAHYHESPVNSKNRGWLENFFGHIDWKRCLKTDTDGTPAINYTGNNITAKNAGFNREMSRINAKLYPHTTEAPAQIEAFVNRLRKVHDDGEQSREMQWLEAWTKLPDEEKRQITDEQFLVLFGMPHSIGNGSRNSIEKTGITATIMGQKISYAVPPALYLKNVGKKVDVVYDPFDLSRVLITDGQGLQFVAYEMKGIAGTYRDMQLAGEGSRAFLNQVLNEKKADVSHIVEQREQRMARLQSAGVDIDHVIQQGGFVAKEIAQAAENAYLISSTGGGDYFDPADLM